MALNALSGMMDDFKADHVETGETSIFMRWSGTGAPILLLHGFPQTHVMWRGVAPLLAREFTVVCADLRGYGQSGCPASSADHAPYSKRAMAQDMVSAMERLGFPRFSVAGHDRGGRVAYRMALDHPDRIERLAVLDILPVETAWERADARFALGYWPWSLLAQPEPLPERILVAAGETVIDNALGGWGSTPETFSAQVRNEYVRALRDPLAHTRFVKNIAPQLQSIARMTGPIAKPGARSTLPCWRCGVQKGRSTPGMPKDPSRCGGTGPMTSGDTRSRAVIFSRNRRPSKRRPRWAGFLPARHDASRFLCWNQWPGYALLRGRGGGFPSAGRPLGRAPCRLE